MPKLNIDFKKIVENITKNLQAGKGARQPRRRERVAPYLRKCKYCKYLELLYCKYHTVTIHPESRACPAFVLKEEFAQTAKKESSTP